MTTTESPMSSPWTDKKQLELWLKPHYGEVTVLDVEAEMSTAKGENYLSNIERLMVKTKEGDEFPLLVKVSMGEGFTAELMKKSTIFKKEQHLYTNILPRIHALLEEAMPDDFEPLAPRCFYSCRSFLVMDDLSPAGFKMQSRHAGLDLRHCSLVMRSIARFHAASAVLHERDPDCVHKFLVSFFHESSTEKAWAKFFTGMGETLVEELETWPAEWKKYTDVLRRQTSDIMRLTQQAVQRDDSAFNVLIHGDLWTNNMLFREEASSVRFVDFQLVYLGSPVIDLLYFLVTSATLEVRVNHLDTLLQEYHSTLCDTLTALGYTRKLMTLEELHNEFDSRAYYGLFTVIAPYVVMQSTLPAGINFDEGLMLGKAPGPEVYGEDYKKAVKWLLPYFERKGLFREDK